MTDEAIAPPERYAPVASADWKGAMRLGHVAAFGGFGLFVLWASLTRLDGAAIAPGVIASESSRKTVQHLEGGIVQEIAVRDGMKVARDQLLLRLDPTRLDTQGDLYRNQLTTLLAQEARLIGEFEGRETLEFPDMVTQRQDDPAITPVLADQRRLFDSRRAAIARNTAIADSQIEQTRKEIELTRSDIATAKATLEQVNAELATLEPLHKRQLVPTTRMAPLEREKLRLAGVISNGEIQLQKLAERQQENELKRRQVIQDSRQEASTQLVEVRRQLNEARQQLALNTDSQKRSEIRAPIAGYVQQMRFFTIGGVIRPGDPVLDIAPVDDALVIRSRVHPNDADRVTPGMKAEIRFPSFNHWSSKAIMGTVRTFSRDRIVDANAPAKDAYFAAEIVVDKSTLPNEIATALSAGITADTVIVTGERSVASYLMKPLTDRLFYSMRER